MRYKLSRFFENRASRHVLFWICWVFGFTFIKSFGKPYEVYFGWFSYYVMTLPIFVVHTYLVVYFLIPRFFNRKGIPVFIISFLLCFYLFSVFELVISNEFIFRWFPTGSVPAEEYLSIGNVIRSGLGNLYIMLVFLAGKTVRDWSISNGRQKELAQLELREQMEETMTRVQPLTLLYAIDHIDRMVEREIPGVTSAIALTSELLSEVMMYHKDGQRWISREIEMVKKLLSLVELFRGVKPEVEFFISGDPGIMELPPMILFSFVDLVIRRYDQYSKVPEMNIEVSGFSNMISIQIFSEIPGKPDEGLEDCMEAIGQLESIHAEKVDIGIEDRGYGCSVIIRNGTSRGFSTDHPV
jgi:two-component system LytT family sensor kinase